MKKSIILIKLFFSIILNSKGKYAFIRTIRENANVLDVGCGNDSPYITKTIRKDIHYVGLDIETYHQSSVSFEAADDFIFAKPLKFHEKIDDFPDNFDAIICSHNLEHCHDYASVTNSMLNSLHKGGTIYISFPCEESVNFPSRAGCLNFYDDPTHKNVINYNYYINHLNKMGLKIQFSRKRYRPIIPFLIGLLYEPFGYIFNKQAPAGGTWALYGFETIIIAKKI